jgi:hypothetical protein
MVKPAPNIKYFEEYFFDNIILMAPSTRGKNILKTNEGLLILFYYRFGITNSSFRLDSIFGSRPQLDDLR